ncbi:MAG: hypothetical protein CSB47_02505 [Proteobacteria bacterium]|nr:MAG: hypothetical protein CSB47_02505 [Pseudomonadota bacterium]
MSAFISRALLALILLGASLPVFALPTLGLGPFGPGVQDGSAPFNADGNCASDTALANPGDDCGEKNNQVRTQDTVIYNWSVTAGNYTPGQPSLKNVIFEQVLKPSANAVVTFDKIPIRCTEEAGGGTNPVSSITTESNGDIKLVCNLGEFNEGEQLSFPSVVKVLGESWNGSSYTSSQRVYSNADDGTPNAVTASFADIGPTLISSRPSVDLSSGVFRGYYLYGARDVGQGVENGYYTWVNLRTSTNRRTGNEALSQPFEFLLDVSATKGAENGPDYSVSGFEYYMVSCSPNPYFWHDQVYGSESKGSGDPIDKKVIDSGTCSTSRTDPANPASPYKITISGADLSGSRFPTQAGGGIDLSAGPYYYTNTVARFFIPMRVIDMADGVINGSGEIFIKGTLKNFDPLGMSGTENFNAGKEPGYNGQPMPGGSISNNIAPPYSYRLIPKGNFGDYAFKSNRDTGAGYSFFIPGNSHSGQGVLAPGQSYPHTLHFGNGGAVDLTNPRTCVAFDNTTQKLTDRGNTGGTTGTYAYVGSYASSGFDYTNYIVEYGHADYTGDDPLSGGYNNQTGLYEGHWDKQRAVHCDDDVTDWKTDPTQVGNGIDDVNLVRARLKDSVVNTAALTSAQYIRFVVPLQIREQFYTGPHAGDAIPSGTVGAGFGSARSDQWASNWTTRRYKASPQNGYTDGDRVIISRSTSRLDSESLTPLAAPGSTTTTLAGRQIVWKLTAAIQSMMQEPPQESGVQIINELPPEVSYNQNCTANYTDASGNVIGTPPDLVQNNTGRNGNAKPGYTRLIWNLGSVFANDAITPRIICTDSDPLAPNGTPVVNYAEIRGDSLADPLPARSDEHTITLEQIGSIQVSKEVDTTLDNTNENQKYTLSWANFAPSFAIDPPTIIDVFSYNGDDNGSNARSPKSKFSGVLRLTGAPTTTWLGGETDGAPLGTWYYTTDAPATINYDPDNNNSNWVTEAALGGDFSQVTAIKFVSAYPLEKDGDPHQGMKATYTLQAGDSANPLSTAANQPGDAYTNLFTLDTPSLPAAQFLKSNATTVEVASYYVGDLVFADVDGDLKYTEGVDVPVPDGVTVQLHKASDNSLVDSTVTGIEGRGRYLFKDVGGGDFYVTIPASQFASNAVLKYWNSLVTTAGSDDDVNEDDDQDGYRTAAVSASGVRTHVFTLSATAPLPGESPKGNEPLGDNVAGLTIPRGDDFTNLSIDIALKPALDFGDAPDSYGGAGHAQPLTPQVYLGVISPDTELSPQNQANGGTDGTGDNNASKRDEDGVKFIDPVNTTDTQLRTQVSAVNKSNQAATLIVWVDFNQNGTFDSGEARSRAIPAGFNSVVQLEWLNLPAGTIKPGQLWVRARISTDSYLTADNASGALFDGEVEDYVVMVDGGVNVSGRVFIDSNSSGTSDAGEPGIARHTVVLYDTVNGTCQSTYTDANGHYAFRAVAAGDYQVYQAQGETVPVPRQCNPAQPKNPSGYASTSPDALSFTVGTTDITGKDFAESKGPVFEPDHRSDVLPGNVVFYPHTFSTPTSGSVRFTTSPDLTDAAPGWSHLTYRDTNCDGVLNGTEANTPIEGINFGVNAGSRFCIVNKVYAPADRPHGDQYPITTTAAFTATGATSAVALQVHDVTTVGGKVSPATSVTLEVGSSRLVLRKTVQNKTQNTAETETLNQARPGDFLTYRIYYRNTGTGPITDLEIDDTIPDYTGYVTNSARCDNQPAGLNCMPEVDVPDLRWLFSGTLPGGAKGAVSYEVMVDQGTLPGAVNDNDVDSYTTDDLQ